MHLLSSNYRYLKVVTAVVTASLSDCTPLHRHFWLSDVPIAAHHTLLVRHRHRIVSYSTSSFKKNMASGVRREYAVCKLEDLPNNEMKEFEIGKEKKKVLLVNHEGQFSAVGASCTHYGAPLVKGVLCNGSIRCPWHGACFNAISGDIEDYPGLDSLPTFETFVRDGMVRIRASESELFKPDKRTKSMCQKQPGNERTFLIIGGGAAGQTCAEVLRQEGFTGNIVLVTKEKHHPYDRPKLSKVMNVDVKTILLRPKEFYEKHDIQVLTGKEATGIDILKKKVTFRDGSNSTYDKLLLATGGRPNAPNIKGSHLNNVCLLRTPEDAFFIDGASKGKHVVVFGSSFIAMEVASCVVEGAASVTVVCRQDAPFINIFGKEIGMRIKQLFEENNVNFCCNCTINEFRGKNGALTEVLLSNKEVLKADICVLGLGSHPNTDFLSGSGIPITRDGHIIVDKKMKTEVDHVFAAGDIAEFPLFISGDNRVGIGHWQMAHAHGRNAALNMLDKSTDIHSVPYFWTVLFKKSIRYAGYAHKFDDVIIDGDLQQLQFVVYLTSGDKVVAVASMNSDPVVSKYAEYVQSNRILKKDEIRNDPKQWKSNV